MDVLNLKIDGSTAMIEIHRPQALNALNKEVLQALDEAIHELKENKSVRCLIITGQGEKAFVAGADIKEIDELNTTTALEFAKRGQSVFRSLEKLPFPVIAAVNGFALGGGLELALSCDVIVATGSAKFGLPECTLGLIPGFGGTVRLARKISPNRAKQMALSGHFYSAEEGYRWGLVNEVVEREQLMETCLKMAETFSQRAPLALAKIKQSMDQGGDVGVDAALDIEAQLFSELLNTEDRKEGTAAFIEKRTPHFKGQ